MEASANGMKGGSAVDSESFPKLVSRTEEFSKSKRTLLWFSSVLLALSFAERAKSGSIIGVDIQIDVLSGMCWAATLYYFWPFLFNWLNQLSLNRKLFEMVVSGQIMRLHQDLKDEFSHVCDGLAEMQTKILSRETIEQVCETATLEPKSNIATVAQSLRDSTQICKVQDFSQLRLNIESVEKIQKDYFYYIDSHSDNLDLGILKSFLQNFLISGKALEDLHAEHFFEIKKLNDEAISKIDNATFIQNVESIAEKLLNDKIYHIFEIINLSDEKIQKIYDKLSEIGKFEKRIGIARKIEILILDGAVPVALMLVALFYGFSEFVYLFQVIWNDFAALVRDIWSGLIDMMRS